MRNLLLLAVLTAVLAISVAVLLPSVASAACPLVRTQNTTATTTGIPQNSVPPKLYYSGKEYLGDQDSIYYVGSWQNTCGLPMTYHYRWVDSYSGYGDPAPPGVIVGTTYLHTITSYDVQGAPAWVFDGLWGWVQACDSVGCSAWVRTSNNLWNGILA